MSAVWGCSSSFEYAPPTFSSNGGVAAVPIDIEDVEVLYVLDESKDIIRAKATMTFTVDEVGHPFFLFALKPKRISLDSRVLDPDRLTTESRSEEDASVQVLRTPVPLRPRVKPYRVEIDYELTGRFPASKKYGAELAFDMTDVSSCTIPCIAPDVYLSDAYFPSNFEFDTFRLRTELHVKNASSGYEVFTNGRKSNLRPNRWRITFSSWSNSASFYLHLVRGAEKLEIKRNERPTRVQIHVSLRVDKPSDELGRVAALVPEILERLIGRLGTFPFEELKIEVGPKGSLAEQLWRLEHLDGKRGGGPPPGMKSSDSRGQEYAGAIWIAEGVSEDVLGHEIAHQWFGRSVRPPSATSGWVDEVVAIWVGRKRLISSGIPCGDKVEAVGPYARHTNDRVYDMGERVMQLISWLVTPAQLTATLSGIAGAQRHRFLSGRAWASHVLGRHGEQQNDVLDALKGCIEGIGR